MAEFGGKFSGMSTCSVSQSKMEPSDQSPSFAPRQKPPNSKATLNSADSQTQWSGGALETNITGDNMALEKSNHNPNKHISSFF